MVFKEIHRAFEGIKVNLRDSMLADASIKSFTWGGGLHVHSNSGVALRRCNVWRDTCTQQGTKASMLSVSQNMFSYLGPKDQGRICENLRLGLCPLQVSRSWFWENGWAQIRKLDFQSPAVHRMAPTSPLNCLSCRVPYKSLKSLNAIGNEFVAKLFQKARFCTVIVNEFRQNLKL